MYINYEQVLKEVIDQPTRKINAVLFPISFLRKNFKIKFFVSDLANLLISYHWSAFLI